MVKKLLVRHPDTIYHLRSQALFRLIAQKHEENKFDQVISDITSHLFEYQARHFNFQKFNNLNLKSRRSLRLLQKEADNVQTRAIRSYLDHNSQKFALEKFNERKSKQVFICKYKEHIKTVNRWKKASDLLGKVSQLAKQKLDGPQLETSVSVVSVDKDAVTNLERNLSLGNLKSKFNDDEAELRHRKFVGEKCEFEREEQEEQTKQQKIEKQDQEQVKEKRIEERDELVPEHHGYDEFEEEVIISKPLLTKVPRNLERIIEMSDPFRFVLYTHRTPHRNNQNLLRANAEGSKMSQKFRNKLQLRFEKYSLAKVPKGKEDQLGQFEKFERKASNPEDLAPTSHAEKVNFLDFRTALLNYMKQKDESEIENVELMAQNERLPYQPASRFKVSKNLIR